MTNTSEERRAKQQKQLHNNFIAVVSRQPEKAMASRITTTRQRAAKNRKKLVITSDRARLSVYRSNKNIYAQIVDDTKNKTIISFSSSNIADKDSKGKTKVELSKLVGENIAKAALAKKIKKVTFDRGGYKYHGRVKALADAAREGGLEF